MVPLVFFDGEREMNIGDVEINPTMEHKPFKIMLSQKMRISPNSVSIHIVHRKPYPEATDYDCRRTPMTGKANFGLICRHKDRCFLVVLKRNQRSKTFSGLPDFLSSERYLSLPPRTRLVPENMVLIRSNYRCVEISDFFVERYDLPPRMRKRYNQAPAPEISDSGHGKDGECRADAPAMFKTGQYGTGKLLFCEECEKAERGGSTTSFHPCVNDTVITSFTTKLGPIKRICS
ncbi:hypothetical protein CASFOL_036474 [Castilleja foliolosa]|uniref:DUF7138 domain-containing protein n=1 Tax=Castilleja foliolosa TaxID=1961234 RepID=A0ABD3BWC5_9LAMI